MPAPRGARASDDYRLGRIEEDIKEIKSLTTATKDGLGAMRLEMGQRYVTRTELDDRLTRLEKERVDTMDHLEKERTAAFDRLEASEKRRDDKVDKLQGYMSKATWAFGTASIALVANLVKMLVDGHALGQ